MRIVAVGVQLRDRLPAAVAATIMSSGNDELVAVALTPVGDGDVRLTIWCRGIGMLADLSQSGWTFVPVRVVDAGAVERWIEQGRTTTRPLDDFLVGLSTPSPAHAAEVHLAIAMLRLWLRPRNARRVRCDVPPAPPCGATALDDLEYLGRDLARRTALIVTDDGRLVVFSEARSTGGREWAARSSRRWLLDGTQVLVEGPATAANRAQHHSPIERRPASDRHQPDFARCATCSEMLVVDGADLLPLAPATIAALRRVLADPGSHTGDRAVALASLSLRGGPGTVRLVPVLGEPVTWSDSAAKGPEPSAVRARLQSGEAVVVPAWHAARLGLQDGVTATWLVDPDIPGGGLLDAPLAAVRDAAGLASEDLWDVIGAATYVDAAGALVFLLERTSPNPRFRRVAVGMCEPGPEGAYDRPVVAIVWQAGSYRLLPEDAGALVARHLDVLRAVAAARGPSTVEPRDGDAAVPGGSAHACGS